MLNNNKALNEEDYIILDMNHDLNYIVIVNKIDLKQDIDLEEVCSFVNEQKIITTSLKKDVGIDDLEIALSHLFLSSDQIDSETAYVSNVRHIHLLKQSKEALQEAREALSLSMPLDMVQIDV